MNLAAVGTSGVGKSHLEQLLKSELDFVPIPKYTDRALRPSEEGSTDIVSITTDEFKSWVKEGRFLFTLPYKGQLYGWLESDLEKIAADGHNATIGITLQSLQGLMDQRDDFTPLFLKITETELTMLEERMRARGEDDASVNKRLELAKQEIGMYNTPEFESMVRENGGEVFHITDDSVLPDQVIPWIKDRI